MLRRLARFGLSLLLVAGASATASADLSKLDPLARRALTRVRAGAAIEQLRAAEASVNAARELDVFITGSMDRAALEAAGARVRTALPGVFTAFVPVDALDRVAALAGVTRIRGASRVKKLLDASVPTTNAPNLRAGAPDFTGLNGAGVIIGDVDTGIDYDHGDFKNPNGTTRLVNIWDQTDLVGPSPSGFGYGAEWNPTTINSHASRETDDDGHGTHVLGIAGGDGSATGGAIPAFTYVGMAPKADLVMVKTDFTDTGILDGVAYVMGRATALGKNAVVNLSLGSLYGPKDGTDPFEAGINALAGPGHIIVAAAGNDGGSPVHSQVIAPSGGSVSTTMSVSGSGAGVAIGIDGYYVATGSLTMTVTTPNATVLGPVAVGGANAAYPGPLTANGNVYIENGLAAAPNGDREAYVEINIPNPNNTSATMNGTWTITFTNGGGSGGAHDETTENLTGSQWGAAAAATPGTVAGGVTGLHALISEVGMRGLNSATLADSTEFIEIYNPTSSTVDLSTYYLSDVNGYAALPVAGTIDLLATNTDFAMRFPAGATIAPNGVKVIAIDGGRYKRNTGNDADFRFFNAGGGATTAPAMTDVATNKGGGYPGFGSLTNGAEFVWLFSWDGASDLVCDEDLVYWGSGSGANAPARKLATTCQDGPDAGAGTTCYLTDAGNPAGSMGKQLTVPSSGSGTRQRVGPEGAESTPGNGCPNGSGGGPGPDPVTVDLWMFYTDVNSAFVIGNDPTELLVAEPGCAPDVITVGAWMTKTSWTDCGGRSVHYTVTNPVGAIADFSSPGPTRDGRQKPDLAAPGMGIGSANTLDPAVSCPGTASELLNDAIQHVVYAGTSMAAPHVAGAAALLMQKYGTMTPAAIKSLLQARAITDGNTGAVWNKDWGYGKLFLGDLSDPLVHVDAPNGGEFYAVGTTPTLTWNASDAYQGVTTVDLLLSRDNGASYAAIASGIANSGSYLWTATGPVTSQARLKVVAHDAATNAGVDSSDAAFTITAPVAVTMADAIADFALAIRSANPAPGAVEIEFAVPRDGPVRLAVYDLLGRRMATLAQGLHAPGHYHARWDAAGARRAASGIYFVRLSAPGRELVRRVVVAG